MQAPTDGDEEEEEEEAPPFEDDLQNGLDAPVGDDIALGLAVQEEKDEDPLSHEEGQLKLKIVNTWYVCEAMGLAVGQTMPLRSIDACLFLCCLLKPSLRVSMHTIRAESVAGGAKFSRSQRKQDHRTSDLDTD
eukprot:5916687-Amphidinium_carterae.1